MIEDLARKAAVQAALELVKPDSILGLGSGRAVFALCQAIGERWSAPSIRAVVASNATARCASDAGIEVVPLGRDTALDVAFDGADEIDPQLNLIKGAGAAMLREKLVIAAAQKVVILAEDKKLVSRLGETRLLPVEVVKFGWEQTAARLESMTASVELRTEEDGPVVTDEGHHIIDVVIPPEVPLAELDRRIKNTLGVVEHGFFLNTVNTVFAGQSTGALRTLTR